MRIAAVTPYPDAHDPERHLAPVEAYAQHLLENTMGADEETSFDVYTYYEKTPRSYMETVACNHCTPKTVRIEQCFRRDAMPYRQVLERIRRTKPDLLHIQHETMMYGGIAGLLLFPFFLGLARSIAPAIATLHHVIPKGEIRTSFKETHNTPAPAWLIQSSFSLFYKLSGWFSTALIVHEEEFKQILIRDYGVSTAKIHVVPHGIAAPIEQVPQTTEEISREFGIPQDADVIYGFFGYISKYKGLDFLLDEFAKYAQTHPLSVLLIAGDMHPRLSKNAEYHAYYDSLKKKAASIPRVVWYGALEARQISHFYKIIDCLVLPYQMKIGSSSVLSLAIGSETPFIVSEVLAPTVQSHAVVFGLYENALAKKMTEFTARNLHAESNFQSFVEELHHKRVWPIIGKKTADVYRKIIRDNAPKSHLIVGAYGQANLGDELLLHECLERLGRDACVVASSDPRQTEASHRVHSISSHGNPLALINAILKTRTIIVGGGDQLKLLKASMHAWKYRLLAQLFAICLCGRILRKKVYLVGIGIGNIGTLPARMLAKAILRLATAVTFRETHSLETAYAIAQKAAAMPGGDLCFLGAAGKRMPSRREKTIGLVPTYEIDHPELFETVITELAKSIDGSAARDPDCRFTLLPFQPSHKTMNDTVVCTHVLEQVQSTQRCTVDFKLNYTNAEQAYAKLDYIWCMRLHSLLLAVLHGIPFIALVYDDKIRNFLADIGMEEWGVELDEHFSAERMLLLQEKLESKKEQVRATLEIRLSQLHQKAQAASLPLDLAKQFARSFPPQK